ncbi:TetR/AcrR family transcriptional regulator [Mycolicibacterium helvum]|uniref:TetR/AcrR family transcriptional regulator n=1 Tax=Mycolicibacterium helvum TaxID=1534349 RepID=UPI001FE4D5AA|nr:TetR/AcrR family transcriptional regulator [Mycolicibacterium helvum]
MNPRQRRAARHQLVAETTPSRVRRATPITVELILDTALGIAAAEGYETLSMRRLATALDTGPASLYAHVVDKADLDGLLIGRLCANLELPEPDPIAWREQIHNMCAQIRDQYLKYPGISGAALAMFPTDLQTLRVSEAMLAILLASGTDPQTAAWTADALLLYIAGYCLENYILAQRKNHNHADWILDTEELHRQLTELPPEAFPHTTRYAAELTAGTGHDRFDFTVTLMLNGLARPPKSELSNPKSR